MKVLLFTHKNDIDGMGSAVLANLAFADCEYVLCGTFDLTESIYKYYENDHIYDYDKIFITDLCMEDPILTKIASDEKLKGKILNLDHHKTYLDEKYIKHPFIKVIISNEHGLTSGTSLFYEYLIEESLIDKDNLKIKEFVELTRQHDTWEWKNIYNNEQARYLAILFDILGPYNYINSMIKKLKNNDKAFMFDEIEKTLINNKINIINEKMKIYENNLIYKDILGLKAGILFIEYEYRNEIGEYLRENNIDIDFVLMIALVEKVISYRSIKDDIDVGAVAEHFGGKGHMKAATNPISKENQEEILKILLEK